MTSIVKKHISTGVTWVAIEEADLFICCGCPADTVKHLKKNGLIETEIKDGVSYEKGPNAILLSDTLIQNGQVANLTEFVILQMLYLQGVNVPNHPNYRKWKPLLIGYSDQIQMQIDYVTVGNHGLSSIEEIMEGDISLENARKIFATKTYYSGGKLNDMEEIVDTHVLGSKKSEIRNGVFVKRLDVNHFEISYKNETVEVDLNIDADQHFMAPYDLPFRSIAPGRFSVTHTGEGNGWDKNRPCMASIIHHNYSTYLIDAGPNILNNLSYLGIGLSQIDGIFLSHVHDDHFAGITDLLNVERRLKLYTTKLIRLTAEKKLGALMNSDIDLIDVAFDCIDLPFDQWTDVNGLEVKPVYSPHTVETNTFSFRVKHENEYKSDAHLSDTINLKEFNLIVSKFPDIFSESEIDYVEKNYLSKVNLKKIDVGGGLIHGHLSDYEHDESELVVLAHTSSAVQSDKENFVNVDFGTTHVLIEDDELSPLKFKSRMYLKQYFDMLDEGEIDLLVNNQKIVLFKPGETIIKRGETTNLYLIISGLVCQNDPSTKDQRLDAGNFIGYSRRYFRQDLPGSYVAWSYVYCIEYEESFLNRFVLKFDLIDDVNSRINMMRALRNTELVDHQLSNAVINWLSKNTNLVTSEDYDFNKEALDSNLFPITRGRAYISFDHGQKISIGVGEHFGGWRLMQDYRINQEFTCDDDIEVLAISVDKIMKVPKLLWRLLELEERGFQMSIFTSNKNF